MLAPDPVIEAYKKDVDRTLLRENLACQAVLDLTTATEAGCPYPSREVF